jgi:hypothetical protein
MIKIGPRAKKLTTPLRSITLKQYIKTIYLFRTAQVQCIVFGSNTGLGSNQIFFPQRYQIFHYFHNPFTNFQLSSMIGSILE